VVCLYYSDISVNCTLWEDYAAKFIKFNKDRKEGGPVIVMLNYCKIKEEGIIFCFCKFTLSLANITILFCEITLRAFNENVGRFPLSVSNTYSFTKLSINENIPEINLFRERYFFRTHFCYFPITYIFRTSPNFYVFIFVFSLPKDEQLMSSSQIQCTQSYGNTQVATEEDLLSNSQILPLSQVIQLDVV
jgi:hypothetical protein